MTPCDLVRIAFDRLDEVERVRKDDPSRGGR